MWSSSSQNSPSVDPMGEAIAAVKYCTILAAKNEVFTRESNGGATWLHIGCTLYNEFTRSRIVAVATTNRHTTVKYHTIVLECEEYLLLCSISVCFLILTIKCYVHNFS